MIRDMQDRNYPAVIEYHDRTKHHYHRYARSAGHMDWDNQPVPFRFYEGSRQVLLPFLPSDPSVPHTQLYRRLDTPAASFTLENIAGMLELSLALSAWKSLGSSRWSLRMNPSSGNLHPTEGYAVLPAMAGISDRPGVYHYLPRDHVLEQRCTLTEGAFLELTAALPPGSFLLGLTSITWREAWKYGERAFRYCQHDVGHAVAALSLAAALRGWRLRIQDWSSATVAIERPGKLTEGAPARS